MWHRFRALGSALCCALYLAVEGESARATVTFEFTYFDPAGVGFNDVLLGPARRASLEGVAADIGSRIRQTATVEVGIAPSEFDGTGFGGTASQTNVGTAPPAAGIFNGEVFRRIVLGAPDVSPFLDAGMAFDFGYDPALSGTPLPGQSYFPDIVRHEMTHLLGYASLLRADGTGLNGKSPDVYYRFDTFIKTSDTLSGVSVIKSTGDLAVSPSVYAAAYAAGLYFDGPAIRAANGGLPLPLYFSSPTHSGLSDDVMFVSPAVGYVRDAWSKRDIAVLTDLGYRIVEPPVLGDINQDGSLTPADIIAMMAALTNLPAYDSMFDVDILEVGDINMDGIVSNADLQALLTLLIGGGGAAAVPEPSTATLLALGAVAALLVRHRRRR